MTRSRSEHVISTLAALLLPLTVGIEAVADSCILPVLGEEPLSDIELEQPYRLGSNPLVLPGYDGLLVRPLNRPGPGGFYEIDGNTYQVREEPAPGSNIFDGEALLVHGGHHILLGWQNNIAWQLAPGSDRWA